MVLALTSQHLADMSAHAERVYPEECCGLLLGKLLKKQALSCRDKPDDKSDTNEAAVRKVLIEEVLIEKVLIETVALDNHWMPEAIAPTDALPACSDLPARSNVMPYTKRRRYSINPKDMLRVQKQARDQGLNIIGVYHSHPDHEAVPSECDRLQAWPDYAYVIVSVQGNLDQHSKDVANAVARAVNIQNWTLDLSHQFQPEAMKVAPSAARDRMPISA